MSPVLETITNFHCKKGLSQLVKKSSKFSSILDKTGLDGKHFTFKINNSKLPSLYYIKQIMTGLEGNRQIYLPREIQDRLPKRFY